MSEPIPVIPLEYQRPLEGDQCIRPFLRNCVIASWVVVLLGTVAIWINVESVLVSGPTLFIVGAFTAIAAWTRRHYAGITLGSCHIAI